MHATTHPTPPHLITPPPHLLTTPLHTPTPPHPNPAPTQAHLIVVLVRVVLIFIIFVIGVHRPRHKLPRPRGLPPAQVGRRCRCRLLQQPQVLLPLLCDSGSKGMVFCLCCAQEGGQQLQVLLPPLCDSEAAE